ncbi:YcaO-related McrA-glycine thioamidation protein [Methanofollis aquaemaris]|uniref:YcaO-related McrA-glycine thioamidation protein n=1 Tax=Methanofollis aquaemaris TaxID=126734 RepID=A0A8A3S6I5_9EURY|nr:YcaO-related McrA-glycine thioamidation protein [Methanofollis aquaemaris]QSZ67280.1 YcaO-related McrA-glycine thioamidation protein [Methanofollis aquaemaris]
MSLTFTHIEKQFYDGTHRTRSPEETLKVIEPLMEEIGVVSVEEMTESDRLRIPCFSAYRPGAALGASKYHAGKGKGPLQAKVSAMMEAVERYSGEYHGDHMEYASFEELGHRRALDPEEIILPRALEKNEKLHWTPGWDLLNEEELLVPSNAVFHPYDCLGMTVPLFISDTNGLASGNVMEEAVLHALLEVIERDCLSSAERRHNMGTRIAVGASGPVRDLLEIFEENGIAIHLWLLEGKTGIPTVAAAADDTVTKDPSLLVMGAGTHLDPEIAALRALTEVAQSRASQLQGGRVNPGRQEFLERIGYDRMKRINREWFREAEDVPIESLPNLATDYFDEDIGVALDEVGKVAEHVLVCDLTRTCVPVVRVIVPGFEVSHMNKDRIPGKRPQ